MKIFGFGILRNGVKYDYPFRESLTSLSLVTEKTYLALGKSDDGTEKAISELPFQSSLVIKPTLWDESLRAGGLILSQQTNVALDFLRSHEGGKEGSKEREDAWGIYLQCDEVIHEGDIAQIKKDLEKANETGCDVVRFRFIHFWQSHHQIAINKKWYPSEIRAVKLNSQAIESWGDAQSFRHYKKVFDSDVPIYHYGHVREQNSYQQKKKDILKLYHTDSLLPKYTRRERKYDNQTECLKFYGIHPTVMRERIERSGEEWMRPERDEVFIVDRNQDLKKFSENENLISKIHAKKVSFVTSLKSLKDKNINSDNIILWNTQLWEKIFYYRYSHPLVPSSMRSKLARPWTHEFLLMLKLSAKGIGMR